MQVLKDFITQLIGTYTTTTVSATETTTDAAGTLIQTVTKAVVIPDYAWIIAAVIFVISLYCIFKLIGGALSSWKNS